MTEKTQTEIVKGRQTETENDQKKAGRSREIER